MQCSTLSLKNTSTFSIDKETAEALVEKDATADVEVLEQSLFMLGQTLE